jgi:hypothetical protein
MPCAASAGKAEKDMGRATLSKENAGSAVGAPSGAAGVAGKRFGSARVGQAGGRATAGERAAASTNSGKPAKRTAEPSGGVPAGGTAQQPAKKRLRAGAPGLPTKGPVQASRPQAAQKSLKVPRSPRLGRARSNVPQVGTLHCHIMSPPALYISNTSRRMLSLYRDLQRMLLT